MTRLAKLPKNPKLSDVAKEFRCGECGRKAGEGRYTLYLCTWHGDLTLVCTHCKTDHNAMHDLAGEPSGTY